MSDDRQPISDHDRLVTMESTLSEMKHDLAGVRRSISLWGERLKYYGIVQALVFGFATAILLGFAGALVALVIRK